MGGCFYNYNCATLCWGNNTHRWIESSKEPLPKDVSYIDLSPIKYEPIPHKQHYVCLRCNGSKFEIYYEY